jgi:hypothetical protein
MLLVVYISLSLYSCSAASIFYLSPVQKVSKYLSAVLPNTCIYASFKVLTIGFYMSLHSGSPFPPSRYVTLRSLTSIGPLHRTIYASLAANTCFSWREAGSSDGPEPCVNSFEGES